MWDFEAGQKVICIDAAKYNQKLFSAKLVEGNIYTIRELFISPKNKILGIRLEEIIGNHDEKLNMEMGWKASRFAPIANNEKGDDISILNKMLAGVSSGDYDKSIDLEDNPYKVKETVDAFAKEF